MAHIRRCREKWVKLVREWRAGGKTAEQFCAKREIRPGTLRWWAWKLDAEEAEPPKSDVLVPVSVAPRFVEHAESFDLALGDVRLRFEVGTDPRYVAAVARAIAAGDASW